MVVVDNERDSMLKKFFLVLVAVISFTVAVVPATPAEAMTSSEVAELQRWLISKGFLRDVADGRYGSKTSQAVMAFRKEIGVTRSFSWSDSLWDELRAYQQPYTRFSEPDRFEVNLTRQVAYLFRGGKLQGVFPIASGNGETYINSYGDPVQAYTPTGSYRFYLHRDPQATGGWHTSYLGSLYKPWYFSGGYAIHGSTSVPAQPASHGCVRLTVWDADWLQSRLYIGMPIHIWFEPPGVGPILGPTLDVGGTAPCPDGKLCDTVAFQDAGGKFHYWDRIDFERGTSSFFYGNPGDYAFSGDWNGDGIETPGLYRRSDGFVYLRNSNTQGIADISFYFGNPGDIPLAGDFDGDGKDSVSIYRPSEARIYVINRLGANGGGLGVADYSYVYGNRGDMPFVGDFDGDGIDTVGLHRPSIGRVYLSNSVTSGTTISSFVFGNPGDRLIAGDWDGDGIDTVAVYRPGNGGLYVTNSNSAGVASGVFYAGFYNGVVSMGR